MTDPVAPTPDDARTLHFALGIIGLGLLRGWLDPPVAQARVAELRTFLDLVDHETLSPAVRPSPHGTVDGYSRWAERYDEPGNALIDAEEPVVRRIIGDLPVGRALDAACGTGRHSRFLADRGWAVQGVDATEAMLDRARAKVPEGEFRVGDLRALPVPDASVDLTVCALALCHVDDLEPALAELARVTRPGGAVILSDMHPFFAILGGTAAFRTEDPSEFSFVTDHHHPVAAFLDAFRRVGLEIVDCVEPTFDDQIEKLAPPPLHPALRQGLAGAPWALIWHLRRPLGG